MYNQNNYSGARVILLSADNLQIYWVGKGGRRRSLNLSDAVSLTKGDSSNSEVCALFPFNMGKCNIFCVNSHHFHREHLARLEDWRMQINMCLWA